MRTVGLKMRKKDELERLFVFSWVSLFFHRFSSVKEEQDLSHNDLPPSFLNSVVIVTRHCRHTMAGTLTERPTEFLIHWKGKEKAKELCESENFDD